MRRRTAHPTPAPPRAMRPPTPPCSACSDGMDDGGDDPNFRALLDPDYAPECGITDLDEVVGKVRRWGRRAAAAAGPHLRQPSASSMAAVPAAAGAAASRGQAGRALGRLSAPAATPPARRRSRAGRTTGAGAAAACAPTPCPRCAPAPTAGVSAWGGNWGACGGWAAALPAGAGRPRAAACRRSRCCPDTLPHLAGWRAKLMLWPDSDDCKPLCVKIRGTGNEPDTYGRTASC